MWKTIEFEPNYEVSIFGEVRSKITNHVKSLRLNKGGYSRVTLYPSGKTYSIHRLVALTFLKDTLVYLKGETDDVQPMRECIEMVEKLGNHTMAKLLEEHLEQFIK